jgi:hypothetical protein
MYGYKLFKSKKLRNEGVCDPYTYIHGLNPEQHNSTVPNIFIVGPCMFWSIVKLLFVQSLKFVLHIAASACGRNV